MAKQLEDSEVTEKKTRTVRTKKQEGEAKPPRKPRAKAVKPITFGCEFCKKEFKAEKTLVAHSCEKKRRWLWKDEKDAVMGFRAYQIYYALTTFSKKTKTQADFIDSQYYTGFTKFGKYLVDINALEPIGFTEFLTRTNVKLDEWTLARPYEIWVREYNKKEDPYRALERSLKLIHNWAEEYGHEWTDFFRKVPATLATKYIKSGKLSPWMLYIVGDDLIARMSDEQLNIVKELLDPLFWHARLDLYRDEVADIKNNLGAAGVC